ncbi:outer membrane beta-barrel protein [Lutibacter sp.]|uniref:outer membrane protein n=1 Tax=Lutibacter sp. TaxID=1925666 RepID=UPI0025B93F95|nr:outer membrane beta-barrel protein [Lutibacter sp.]MCF6169100.1 outer membrane beta-barrel protein [Lutibacter sp.]
MKKNFMLFVLLIYVAIGTAQEIYLETGKTLSTFKYKTSQGQGLDNLQATSQNFITVGYRNQFLMKNLNASIGVAFAGIGAIGSDDTVDNFMKWDMNYLEFNVGLDYNLYKIKRTTIYLKVNTSAGFLIQGTQTLNNKVINLKKTDDFSKTVFGYKFGLGVLHPISKKLSFYVQYLHGNSLKLKSSSGSTLSQEELNFVSDNISLGLFVNISK